MARYNTTTLYMRKTVRQAMKNVWQYPLTVVEAPMGYGKTTTVKKFLHGRQTTVLWQTLTGDSVSGFWRGFSKLFTSIDSQCAASLAELGVPDNSIRVEEAMQLIAAVVFPQKTAIVIDDYHLLSSATIDRFIELLVKDAHPNLHIVIISRALFGENTTELALKGYCNVVDKSYFELTQNEIIEYYKLCGISLSQREAVALYDYTEGWISALYLCMLSFVQEGRIDCDASLHELIEKAVYRNCHTEVKDFLVSICIFDHFTLKQAKAMWHKENADALLRQLVANNAFIKYDKVSKTYHIHNVFTSYLRDLLDKQVAPKRQAVFAAAGDWYVNVRDHINAMDSYYQAADFDKLLTVFVLDKGWSINNKHKELLIRYFTECPTEIKRQHPLAGLLYLGKLILFNEEELFATQYNEIVEYINGIQDEATKNRLTGELKFLIIFTKYNDTAGLAEQLIKVSQLLKGPSQLFGNNSAWNYGAPSILYLFYRQSGQLDKTVNQIIEAMPYYCKITDGHGAGAEYVMQAERYYYSADFENAEITGHKAMYIACCHQQTGIKLCAMFLQIRLALVKGNLFSALDILQQMRAEVKQYGKYMYVDMVDMCEGFIYSCLKQENKIAAWIVQGHFQESRLHYPGYPFFNIIYGRVLLLRGEYLKLIGIATQFISIANVYSNLLGQVYAYIYLAAAQYQLKHYQEAEFSLKQAANIAAPDQLVMPFVENGEYIIDILADLETDEQYADFVNSIRNGYSSFRESVKIMELVHADSYRLVKLTAREREIAELVAEGLSNQTVAESLNIAEVTVKKTLQNVYAKLGIGSRTALAKIILEQNIG